MSLNRNRRSNTTTRIAPTFQLHNVPPRTLLPMAPVGMDSMGNTTYAPRTTTGTTGTNTTTLVGDQRHSFKDNAGATAPSDLQKKKSPDDDEKKGGDRDGQSRNHHHHSSSSHSDHQQQHSTQQSQDDSSSSSSSCCGSSAACVIRNALYLGGEGDANSATLIRKLRIRRILNVADEISLKGCWLAEKKKKNEEEDEKNEEEGEKLPPASVVSPVSVVSVVSSLSSTDSTTNVVVPWNVEVKHIKLRDHSDEDISAHFDEAIRFIREGIINNEPVLVHCRFGVSRSATIVIAYLMKYGASLYPSPSTASAAAAAAAEAAAATTQTNQNNNRSNNNNLSNPSLVVPLSPLALNRPLPMTPRPMSYQDSFDYVKARRPQVSPNLGFVLALHRLDGEMMNRSPLVTASPQLH